MDSLITMKARFDGRLKYYAVTDLSRQDYALVKGLGDNDVKVQHRWDFESIQGGAFFWNDDRGGFDAENGEYIGDEAVYRLIEEASRGLGEGLANDHIRSCEVRPVFAVGR